MNSLLTTSLTFKNDRHRTVVRVFQKILDRITWYHFLTPPTTDPDAQLRGRVVSDGTLKAPVERPKFVKGHWDVLIP